MCLRGGWAPAASTDPPPRYPGPGMFWSRGAARRRARPQCQLTALQAVSAAELSYRGGICDVRERLRCREHLANHFWLAFAQHRRGCHATSDGFLPLNHDCTMTAS